MLLKLENQIRAFFVNNADAHTEHIFGIDFNLMLVQKFQQSGIVVNGRGQFIVIAFTAESKFQLVVVLQHGPMLVRQHVHIFVVLQQGLRLPAEIIFKIFIGGIMGGNFDFIGRFGESILEIFGIVNRLQVFAVAAHHGAHAQNLFDFVDFAFVDHSGQNLMELFNPQIRRIKIASFGSFDAFENFDRFQVNTVVSFHTVERDEKFERLGGISTVLGSFFQGFFHLYLLCQKCGQFFKIFVIHNFFFFRL